ncbi:MAG: ABC transporter ATP-binding protein [bacterium]
MRSNSIVYLFSKIWHYSLGNRRNVVLYWVMFLIANSVALIATPLVSAAIVNEIQTRSIVSANLAALFILLLLDPALEIFFWSLHGPGRVIERINAFKMRANYRKHLLRGVLNLPMSWHVDHHSGDTIDKIEKGTAALFDVADESFEIISNLVQFVVSYIMLAYFCHPAAGIVALVFAAAYAITARFDRTLIQGYNQISLSENNVSESVYDAVGNISTVITLRVERRVLGALIEKILKPFEIDKKNAIVNEVKWFIMALICSLMSATVLGVYFYQHMDSPTGVQIGSVVAIITYLRQTSKLFFNFTYLYSKIVMLRAKVRNAELLADEFAAVPVVPNEISPDWRLMQVEGLSFSYHGPEESEDLHMDNVSFTLRRGERVAVVGESGSGKTTLLKLMRDLYTASKLRLTVDGSAIKNGFAGIGETVTLVPQNSEIFATTMLANITMGADYPIEKILKYTDMARVTKVIRDLPKGFDSQVKEKGVNLSGGQQQRLALARGLLACEDKTLILLDESTSSVDLANEKAIYRSVFEEFKEAAILSSIHRLYLLPLFDRVFMFHEGRLVGTGTVAELLVNCPEFRRLHEYGVESEAVGAVV